MTLSADRAVHPECDVLAAATRVWKTFYGNARSNRTCKRLDAGLRQKRQRAACKETMFRKQRRLDVEQGAKASDSHVASMNKIETLTAGTWNDAMASEANHMRLKRGMRLMQTVAAGVKVDTALLGGMTPEEITRIYTLNCDRLKQGRAWKRSSNKIAFRLRGATALHGLSVFWSQPEVATRPDVKHAISTYSLKTTVNVRLADIVVTEALHGINHLARWQLTLHGGRLALPEYVVNGGRIGACVSYMPAVKSLKRSVWVSANWATRHPILLAILDDAVVLTFSKWTRFIGTNEEFVARAIHDKHLLGIVTSTEKDMQCHVTLTPL